jgi:pimeloyl-ACP methyl ester carboxylesterase
MKNIILSLFVLLVSLQAFAHGFDEYEESIAVKGLTLSGTLTIPAHAHGAVPLVIIIAGSGPTDRNCNGQGFKSDAFKKMANTLASSGIASYRYDKRGVGKSLPETPIKEEELRFDDMVNDAKAIIAKYEKDARFKSITIVGHSEGSLVGMLAVNEKTKYVSLAGISTSADVTLKDQLKGKLGTEEEATFKKLDELKKGKTVTCENPMLMTLFRPSVQPYLISWFKYNPSAEIKKLNSPILIINGTKDIQVSEEHAKALHKANPKSKLVIVPNMNHVLTEITTEEDNVASYNKPELLLSKKMMDEIIFFATF